MKIIEKKYDNSISEIFQSPNNTLGIEYIKALDYFNSNIKPVTIARKSVDHDSMINCGDFASASLLRKNIINNLPIKQYIPTYCDEIIKRLIVSGEISDTNNLDKIIIYKLLSMSKNELDNLPDANNGLSDRLYKYSRIAKSYNELLKMTKTKCFTLARIRRVISYALLGIKQSDFNILPPYARILAFNDKGCEILAKIKESSKIPVSTSLTELSSINSNSKRFAKLDEMASNIFSLSVNNKDYRKNEYSVKVQNTK